MRHPANERQAIHFLRRLGCRRHRWASFRQQFLIALSIAAFVWAGLALFTLKQGGNSRVDFGSAVAVATAIFALMQWRAAAQDKAVEAYGEKTAALNEKIAEWNTAMPKLLSAHFPSYDQDSYDQDGYRQDLYCYIALDNLEFALERYENGSASGYTAAQEVMTFGSKLRSPEFQRRSQVCIDAASYSPIIKRVYRRMIRDVARN